MIIIIGTTRLYIRLNVTSYLLPLQIARLRGCAVDELHSLSSTDTPAGKSVPPAHSSTGGGRSSKRLSGSGTGTVDSLLSMTMER
jgi:hypothetical protein